MRKITISKRMTFEAAHYLPNHPGACSRLHGHRWELEVEISIANETDLIESDLKDGMVIDYSDLKERMEKFIISKYDHQYLNELNEPFSDNPTSERIALHIFNEFRCMLPFPVRLESITLKETENSKCKVMA